MTASPGCVQTQKFTKSLHAGFPVQGCNGNQKIIMETKNNATENAPESMESIRRCNENKADMHPQGKPRRAVAETTEKLKTKH